MQKDGFLDELLARYDGAGGEGASYEALEEVFERASSDLHAWYRSVARDYVERLEHRLRRSGARLTQEECDLIRAWEGVLPQDEAREQRLLDDLAALDALMAEVRSLGARTLPVTQIARLRGLLGEGLRLLPGIARDLAHRRAAHQLESELGDGGATMKREQLRDRLARGLAQDDGSSEG